ncbi:MAG: hypothetical protein ACR2GY_01095 [Phycisphaerales bacterium]
MTLLLTSGSRSRLFNTSRPLLGTIFAIAIAAILLVPAASAQRDNDDDNRGRGRVDLGELRRPEYTAQDMSNLVDLLGINDNQAMLIEIFLGEYTHAYRDVLEEVSDEVEVFEEQVRYARESNRSPVDRAELSDASRIAINPLLEEYAEQLDYALQARDGRLAEDTSTRDIIRAIYRGEMDERDAIREAKVERTTRVRDVNLQYAEIIRARLFDFNEEEAAAFDRAVREEAFGRIYRNNHGVNVFEAALAFETLDESLRSDIEAMQTAYLMRLNQINRSLERLTLLEEPHEFEADLSDALARMRDRGRGGRGRGGNDDSGSRIRDIFDDRETLEAETILRLHTLLTEEQVLELPRRRRGRDRN